MQIVTDRGCCNLSLKKSCLIIGGWMLFSILVNVFTNTRGTVSILGSVIVLVANVCLIYGSIKENRYLVLVWLLASILFYIGWPIIFIATILNVGGHRQNSGTDSLILALVIYIIVLIFYLFCTRIVYSYYHELRNKSNEPKTNVVV